MIIEPSVEDATHVAEAIAAHRRRAVRDGFAVPLAVVQIERMMRLRISRGQAGSTFDSGLPVGDGEPMPARLLTYDDTGRVLAVSTPTVKRLIAAGELTPVHIGKAARLRASDVDAYVERLAKEAATC